MEAIYTNLLRSSVKGIFLQVREATQFRASLPGDIQGTTIVIRQAIVAAQAKEMKISKPIFMQFFLDFSLSCPADSFEEQCFLRQLSQKTIKAVRLLQMSDEGEAKYHVMGTSEIIGGGVINIGFDEGLS